MRELPNVPPSRHGVFTTAEAVAAGWSRDALAYAVATGRLIRLGRGVYCVPLRGDDPVTVRERFASASVAAALVTAQAAASHRSSAVLAGLPTWTLPERPCITVRPGYTGDARRAHLHRATLGPGDVLAAQVTRTRSARTIVDVARESGLEEAVVIGDAALRRGLADLDRIAATLALCAAWPGAGRARHLIGSLDPRAESPLESVSRLRLVRVGIPAPEPQVDIFDRAGHFLGRLDFYWDAFGVAGEVDGKVKFRTDPVSAAWNQTKRQELLSETGLLFVRWGRAELDAMPALAARLTRAFARGVRRAAADRLWIARPSLAPQIRAS